MILSDDRRKLLKVTNEDVQNGQFIIPETVTSIGEHAFDGCTGLTHLTISDSVESIGHGAFNGCIGLTQISIPGSVTSIVSDAFENCSSLQVIAIEDKDSNEYQRLVNLLPQAQQHLARPWSELNAAITIKQKALTSVAALSMNGLTAHLLSKLLPPKYKGTIVGTAPFFRALNDARRSALLGPDVVVSDFRPHKGLPNQMLPRLCSKLAASFCRYPAVAQIRLPLSQEEFKFEHVTTAAFSRGMLLPQPPTSSPESDSTTQKASFELSDLITAAFLIFMATTSLLYPLAIGLLDIFFLIYPLIYSLSLIWMTFSTDLDQNKITRCLTKTWNERHMVYLFLWPLMIYNVLKICSLYFTHPIVLHLIFTANFCAITLTAISLFGLCALFLDAPIFKNEPFTSDSDPLRKPKKLALFAHAMNSGFYCVNQSLLTLATFISSSMKTPAISLIIAPFVNAALPVGALISTLHFCHLSYRAIQTKNPQLDSGEINSFAKK